MCDIKCSRGERTRGRQWLTTSGGSGGSKMYKIQIYAPKRGLEPDRATFIVLWAQSLRRNAKRDSDRCCPRRRRRKSRRDCARGGRGDRFSSV